MKNTVFVRRLLAPALVALSLPAALGAEHEIAIVGYRYVPQVLEIRAGDTVTWVNNERRTSHSIVLQASGEESERLFPGEHWSRRFDEPGRQDYRCGPHPEMKGQIIVGP